MKRTAIINIVIGAIWIAVGIVSLINNVPLALFGAVRLPNPVVIVIGIVWTSLGVFALVRDIRATAPPVDET